MTTEYEVRLDRDVCDGIFACLVRDDRFVEAADGLASLDGHGAEENGELVARFDDDRLADAEQAARACPVGAIDVFTGTEGNDE
jgi:ferredoxin